MKKYILLIPVIFLCVNLLFADEGMWIPSLLGEQKLDDMRKKGLKLSAEDIYSINQASLKDAIVLFGRGCTGAIVSGEGLLLTNHHCGFGSIQRHSSIEHDYLTDGFWAMNRGEELSNPGLTVSLLVRMEDVTGRILAGVKEGMSETDRQKAIDEAAKEIIEGLTEETHLVAEVKPLFGGNQYFLYVMEVFKDVRLVGAPPSAIGNFGGDTDNWMWPRHTGDFSIFRIYADSNNLPAEYAKNNVPYKPKKSLAVSLQGVDKGDFTMVYGYPAATRQYLPSYMVDFIANESNPEKIQIRREKLDIMGNSMNADPNVRIQYASKYAGVANAWKKWLGESKGLNRFDAVEKKEAFENDFMVWADKKGPAYTGILPAYRQLTEELKPVQLWIDNFSEAVWSLDIMRFTAGYRNLAAMEKPAGEDLKKETDRLKSGIKSFFKDYDLETDKRLFTAMLDHFRESVKGDELPDIYQLVDDKFNGDINAFTEWAYDESIFVSEEKMNSFIGSYTGKKAKTLKSDPIYKVMSSFYMKYLADYSGPFQKLMVSHDSLQRVYMKAITEIKKDQLLFADANSTLRISYGVVKDYFPQDGVYYKYETTLAGIMEKDDPEIYDYRVPARLKELYALKDYGRYGQDGEMYVCFTSANHTTGGNSGSPVLNASGELIGLNFDRNFEGAMSDIMYDPDMCRNIVLDIRYCLFIIDKYAGAGHLVGEMSLRDSISNATFITY
jgi:hypothetical protein